MTVAVANDRLLRAARGEKVDATPIWMMRQAGRVLPGYRKMRDKYSFTKLASTPNLCAQVTTEPVDALGVDAAILFSDILMPLPAMGIEVEFQPGPVLDPWDRKNGIDSLRVPDPAKDWAYLGECIEATIQRLDGRVPLIGFAGAPYTLATYILEGGSSRAHERTRAWMTSDPEGFREFLFFLADRIAEWIGVQMRAGIHAFQLFDSWAGMLAPVDQARYSLAAAKRVFQKVKAPEGFPTIYFAPGAGGAIREQANVGSLVLGIDWRVRIAEVRELLPDRALQGNLDPGALLGSEEEISLRVRQVLEGAGTGAGHIFNLGHGILPMTPVSAAMYVVEEVHRISRELRQ